MDESLLLVVAAALLALVAAGLVAAWTAKVSWHRLRGGDRAGLGLRAAAARPRASVAWWSVRATRRRLGVAVRGAERTVAAAERVHAPLGELPTACRELRRLQRDLDRRLLLAAAHGRRPDAPTAGQVATVGAHAERIRLLAARSLDEVAESAIRRLAETVDTEAAALDAGRANWRRQTDPALRS